MLASMALAIFALINSIVAANKSYTTETKVDNLTVEVERNIVQIEAVRYTCNSVKD